MRMKKLILTAFLVVIFINSIFSQPDKGFSNKSKVVEGKRLALVIGNSSYKAVGRLNNTLNDSREMRTTLTNLGFSVIGGDDLSGDQMKRAIKDFGQKLSQGGVGLFYYSGHGIQANGRNFLIPVDAPDTLQEATLEFDTVDVNRVLAEMAAAKNGFNIVILDACRNNPFGKGWRDSSGGLAQIKAPTGTLIAYATAPDTTASDGIRRNGTYTEKLLQRMQTPNIPIEQVFKSVSEDVFDETSGKQDPWYASSLKGDFYFNYNGNNPVTITNGTTTAQTPKINPTIIDKRPTRSLSLNLEDSVGAVIPGVFYLYNIESQQQFIAEANENGKIKFPSIPFGNYFLMRDGFCELFEVSNSTKQGKFTVNVLNETLGYRDTKCKDIYEKIIKRQ